MKGFLAGGAAVAVLLVIFILSPFTVVGSGERGIITQFGEVKPEILGEGFHWIHPLDSVHTVDVRTQTISFDNNDKNNPALGAASKDLQDVGIAIVVNYHPDPTKVNTIFQTFGDSYEDSILAPIVRDTTKSVSARFTAEELVTKRAEFGAAVEKELATKFTEKLAIFERANVVNLEFSKSFSAAIEAKVTAEQDALASKNKLEQTKYEAEQKVVTAQAEAESLRIQAQALANNASLVELEAVRRWDGKLPTYMMGDTMPFINLSK